MTDNVMIHADGTAALIFRGEVPWHKLGEDARGAFDSDAALKKTKLDFPVDLRDTYLAGPNGELGQLLRKKALVRLDTGDVLDEGGGKNWTPVQNRDMLRWVDPMVRAGYLAYEVVGALGNGHTIWALLRAEGFSIHLDGKVDDHERFVLVVGRHKFGHAHLVGDTAVRVVCQNTLMKALSSAETGDFERFQHSRHIQDNLDEARDRWMAAYAQSLQDTTELLTALAKKPATDELVKGLFAQVWTLPNGKSAGSVARRQQAQQTREVAFNLYQLEEDFAPGTLYAGLQAVTAWATHNQGKRTDQAHFENAVMGDGPAATDRYLALARQALG